MDLILNNILPLAGTITFILGLLSVKYDKYFKLSLLLLFPLAWAVAKFAPGFLHVASASESGGFLTFYVYLFESMTDYQQLTVKILPIVFMAGYAIAWTYMTHFYKERIETIVEQKARVRKYYGVQEFD
ncbi:MAG: hypothetical protein HKN36_00305 [Hellea sp.]|nr:hypothetical protein [Hellea sp.]